MTYRAILAATLAVGSPYCAVAAVVTGSISGGTVATLPTPGQFIKLPTTPGFSVGTDNWNTNNLYAFDEAQDFQLTADLAANLGLTAIAAGTWVRSHFVFFDPLDRQTVRGSITFDSPVLAVITLRPELIASNYLGAPTVRYMTPSAVGLEPGLDFVTIGIPGANDLRVNLFDADSPGDHVRVITQGFAPVGGVPEPATWAMMIAGFGTVGATLRRRRARSIEIRA